MTLPNGGSLVFREGEFDRLRKHLLESAPLEAACFVFAREVITPRHNVRLLVVGAEYASDEDYLNRSPVAAELTPSCVARAAKKARSERLSVFLTHSHPTVSRVEPSGVDRDGERIWVEPMRRRANNVSVGRLIVGPYDAHAALLDGRGGEARLSIVSVGNFVRFESSESVHRNEALRQIHDRQARAFGEAGQRVLSSLRIGIVGVGGTGSIVAEQLAHLGVGSITVIDDDTIEATNLNRVVGARLEDVGVLKADVAAQAIQRINSGIAVRGQAANIQDASALRVLLDCDLFFCCTDSEGSRAVLNQFAYQYWVPGIDLGVVIRVFDGRISRIAGRVQMLTPGQACLVCADILDPEQVRRDLLTDEQRSADRYVVGDDVPQPAVISINGIASSLAVTMMLSVFTGLPFDSRYALLRLESGLVSRAEAVPEESCPVCSSLGAYGRGDSFPPPGRLA
ncbi:MAG TPA: ThiF family adenylyltransferase [Gemmatimonadaceae bacterium]|jgi:molybdopterin/thiamine biosynthesis adenylyltransferase/proteasome lid subunit RPN8/RPN11